MNNKLTVFTTVLVTSALWLAVFSYQSKEQEKWQSKAKELSAKQTSMRQAADRLDHRKSVLAKQNKAGEKQGVVSQLTNALEQDFDLENYLLKFAQAQESNDLFIILKNLTPLVQMDDESLKALRKQMRLDSNPFFEDVRDDTLYIIDDLLGREYDPQDFAGNLMSDIELGMGSGHYSVQLQQWASRDPKAAISWMEKRLVEGKLKQVGLAEDPERDLHKALLSGLTHKDPEQAVQYFAQMDQSAQRKVLRDFSKRLREKTPKAADLLLPLFEKDSVRWRQVQRLLAKPQEGGAN